MSFSPFFNLFLISSAITSLGFFKFIYFISIGYTFSICSIGFALFVMYRKQLTLVTTLLCLILIIYGLRLGTYLIIREKGKSYNEKMKKEGRQGGKKFSIGVTISTWLTCALLYVMEASPVLFRLENGKGNDLMAFIGIIIGIAGIIFEGLSDQQKQEAKKKEPTRFVSTGLYSIVRCPNYFGEILMWTGIFVSGITAYNSIWQWLSAIFGYICIVIIMCNAVLSLEKSQMKSYGEDEKFQEYIKKTPILIPFVPLYTLSK